MACSFEYGLIVSGNVGSPSVCNASSLAMTQDKMKSSSRQRKASQTGQYAERHHHGDACLGSSAANFTKQAAVMSAKVG